ncbi:ATP-grasp domain-containing protein [Flavobacteriaceae bacterium 144Ye]|nr:ATP-grasp domain-containing protein [Flavobacteriaceae bacterium 144Ye]
MNVLLTSAGRRSYLVAYFKEAVASLNGIVHVCNSTSLCSAFQFADYTFVSPNIYSKQYIPEVLNYCLKHNITLVVPLFDIDLLVLSKHKDIFEKHGITVVVSDTEVISKCNDKWSTYLFLKAHKLNTPKSYLVLETVLKDLEEGIVVYPLLLKPRWGMGSIGVFKADNKTELLFFYEYVEKQIHTTYLKYESSFTQESTVIIQEFVDGKEFGLDVINDLQARYVNTFVKEKLAMRSGETDISKLVTNTVLSRLGASIANHLKHLGNLDVDVMFDGVDYKVIEMNARFGGGYPFTHSAGVDLPKAIVAWALGQTYTLSSVNDTDTVIYKYIGLCNGK